MLWKPTWSPPASAVTPNVNGATAPSGPRYAVKPPAAELPAAPSRTRTCAVHGAGGSGIHTKAAPARSVSISCAAVLPSSRTPAESTLRLVPAGSGWSIDQQWSPKMTGQLVAFAVTHHGPLAAPEGLRQ